MGGTGSIGDLFQVLMLVIIIVACILGGIGWLVFNWIVGLSITAGTIVSFMVVLGVLSLAS